MKQKTVEIDIDLDDWTSEELLEELRDRGANTEGVTKLQSVWEHYHLHPEQQAPKVLKDYIYEVIGKIL